MEFFDEVLIKARNEARKEKYHSLETGMYAGEELLSFHRELLFDGKVSLCLPDHYEDMPENLRRIKYPYEDRPPIIKTSGDGSVNFNFSLMTPDTEQLPLTETLDGFLIVLKKMNPLNLFYDKGVLKAQNVDCAWCEIKGQNLDGSFYNVMFISEIGSSLLLGNLNCPYKDNVSWRKIIFEIMKSIREEG